VKASLFIMTLAICAIAMLGARVLGQVAPGRQLVVVGGREAIAGEVLVKLRRQPTAVERQELELRADGDASDTVGTSFRRVRSRSLAVQAIAAALRTHPLVEYAEPNFVWHASVTPNDPQFSNLWGLRNIGQTVNGRVGTSGADIHAFSAWSIATGSRANVVAVIDTGMDYTHPDLVANVWNAPASFTVTIGGGITCAAGTHGFNAITRTCDPLDDNNHGTHVSGTIGGAGNNALGVIGVNWNASIMALKFLDSTGTGSTSAAIDAIEFAIQAKTRFGAAANVRVLSNSWGGAGFSQALLDEINKASTNGMLFVAAAGNDGTSNDTTPTYPANYNAASVISVAATDSRDVLATFSNFGTSVNLAAPGVSILSTVIGGGYAFFNGTSMATPHVSGSAALILSKCTLDTPSLKALIINNVDVIAGLSGKVGTSGRLNVDRAIRACAPAGTTPSAPRGVSVR